MAAASLAQKVLALPADERARPDVRCAATVVLAATGAGDKAVITALADALGTESAMVRRFVTVGALCLAALALVYAWGVRLAWRKAKLDPGLRGGDDR